MAQFFLEGLMLTGVSGGFGIVAAGTLMAALTAMTAGANTNGFDPPRLVPWSVALAVGTLTLSGCLAGLVPARRAAMLEPVEALRKD
jgi:putative ABC transport system permease protein